MKNEPDPDSDLILYQTEDGRTRIQCRFENETVWHTQQHMAELFQTTQQNVSLHVRNIYEEGELAEGQLTRNACQFARRAPVPCNSGWSSTIWMSSSRWATG